MRYIEDEGRIVWSASDLKAAAECEFAWLRAIDAKLGRVPAVEDPEDATLERAGRLGTQHELRVLDGYRDSFPGRVVEIAETRSSDAEGLAAAVAHTRQALADPEVEVIYQAAFSTGEFVGFADFLVRDGEAWLVQDTKLARHARVTALMQLAAYVDQLDALGVARSDRVELLLGDGTTSRHAVRDLLPVFSLRRDRLRALIADRDLAAGPDGEAIAWGDERGALRVIACGRCATCDLEVIGNRDLLLVAGMRPVQRDRLRADGIRTIDDLAAAREAPARMSWDTFRNLRTQARLQLASPAGGLQALTPAAEGHDPSMPAPAPAVPTYEVVFPKALGALPRPDHGDLFFDFEGDPLYTENPAAGSAPQWGIDYLFGWVDTTQQYTPLWAHSFAEERAALEAFLEFVALRRRTHPNLHIYHYAPYEPTHLLAMAARHGVGEAAVDRLLREGVFVDLYPIVRRALRVGSRSYSIKKLEPLYMGDEVRTSDVQRGDDSIVRYVEARALADAGEAEAARAILDDLADYNRYDCVSTLRLRDWLVDRAREAGLRPSVDEEVGEYAYAPSVRAEALLRRAAAVPVPAVAVDGTAAVASAGGGDDDPDAVDAALRLGAAAIDYYPREAKTFWATHFLRLREPVSVWEDTRDVMIVDADRCRVVTDWHQPEGARVPRRVVELRGSLAPGTRLTPDSTPFVVYDLPAPFPAETNPRWIHAARTVKVVEVLDDGAVVEETSVQGFTWQELPLAVTPVAPPLAGSQQSAIDEWADAVLASGDRLPADPATDLLLRRRPRTGRGALARGGSSDVADITSTLIDLHDSYVAVQGPPGTGKTFVGSHVVACLVRDHGFRVGVVAQSHAVVEHMLDRIVDAGVPRAQVAKAPKGAAVADTSFTPIAKNGMAAFIAEQQAGFVVGGTAWDFTHTGRIGRRSLDLLVIDEAGQFSLASTIAVAASARRLLLLGDPQQLPQVSQGTHPEPVDTSALGWIMGDASVIPEGRGYFLAQSRRMRPEVAEPVSQLSYEGRLEAFRDTVQRRLDGIPAGVIPVPLGHLGNATQSTEEADAVVALVRDLVGRAWTPEAGAPPRPLRPADIIVVTPYNAQQVTVEEALSEAGYGEVPVGTVDRFQGQEAAVAIVSLAASSGRDAPRGLEFLLLQNRLNVAVSRAMHTAYVVYGTGLLDDLPRTPEGVARLSAFARLVGVHAGT
jgi:uncharacterized protein